MTWHPAASLRSVTIWPRALTISPLPYSTEFAMAANGEPRSGNGEKALNIAPITGATMVSIIWSNSTVKPRISPSRAYPRTENFLRPCMPLI